MVVDFEPPYLLLTSSRMAMYSTRETARKLGLHYTTFHRYIAAKKVPLPVLTRVGGVRVRLWSDADIEKIRKLLPKIQNGRKTRQQNQRKQTKKKKP
jgi:predicted DNA-binding transcriptional regulator AlpA